MNKNNLVLIKGSEGFNFNHTDFKTHINYRSIRNSDGSFVIYGEHFSKEEFNDKFEFSIDRVLRHWLEISLLKENGKPINFTNFGKLTDIHTYTGYFNGKKTKKRILFFRNNREISYGFYPLNVTKLNDVRESYQMYLDTVNGNPIHLDNDDIQFGNCGIPLSYSYLRIR
jgi:hypothetical protein